MRRPSQAGAATASCGGNTGYEEGEQQQQQQSGEEEQEEEEEEELESFSDDEAQAPMQVHVGHVHGATARNAGTSYGTPAVRGFGEGSSTVAGGGSGGRRWIQAWRDNNNDENDDDDDYDDDGDVDEIDSSNDDTAVEECRLITPEGQEDRPPVMKSSTCDETPSSVASTVAFSDDEPSDLAVSPAAAGVTVAGGIQRVGLAGLARQR